MPALQHLVDYLVDQDPDGYLMFWNWDGSVDVWKRQQRLPTRRTEEVSDVSLSASA